jgi:uncharacterized protein (DUF1778 family)
MARSEAGDVNVLNRRGDGLPKEANKIRPCVIVEDTDLFAEEHPNVIVVPLTTNASTIVSQLGLGASAVVPRPFALSREGVVTRASSVREAGRHLSRLGTIGLWQFTRMGLCTYNVRALSERKFLVREAARRPARTQNLILRITPDDKGLIEQAATIVNEDVTTFLLAPALIRARTILDTDTVTTLTGSSRDLFFALMDKPPSETLIRNFQDDRHEILD